MKLLGLIIFSLIVARPARALTLEEFQEKMAKHVASLSGKTTAGVRIEILGAERVLYSHNETQKLIPASNAKLLTAQAALEKLGPGFTFETKVYRQGSDLIVAGGGDPYLVSERLWLLAREVARAGVKTVGVIKVSNHAYRETYRGLTEFEESGEPFTALVSATGLNFNSLEIHVVPGDGPRPHVEAGPLPNAYALVKNEVQQTSGRERNLTVKAMGADGARETFVVSGTIGRRSSPAIVYGAVGSPEAHFASVLAALLRKEGITVAKDFGGIVNGIPAGEPLVTAESPPLQDLIRLFNNYSNNYMAEEVFQALGAAGGGPASVEKSRSAMNDFLSRHAACAGNVVPNGSGLAWEARVSASCFTEAMQVAYRDFRVFADLLGSLPAGGETGTLKHRFQRTGEGFEAGKVRGKTGTLWSRQVVSSLTGITAAESGQKILFSLIENDLRNDRSLLRGLKDWEDQCVELVQQLKL